MPPARLAGRSAPMQARYFVPEYLNPFFPDPYSEKPEMSRPEHGQTRW